MDKFEIGLRGRHAQSVQDIMARTTGFLKRHPRPKAMKPKGDNNSTYLEKYNLDLNNLNLAKRILLCQSQHNHKFYKQQWERNKSLMRLRSNFKRGLSNQQPRIFKFQPIQGKGTCLVTITFTRFISSPINFRTQNTYLIQMMINKKPVTPTNSIFQLNTLQKSPMSFYIPKSERKNTITCNIFDMKSNQVYFKGKMQVNLAIKTDQQIQITNRQKKVIAAVLVNIEKTSDKNFSRKFQQTQKQNIQHKKLNEKGDLQDEKIKYQQALNN